MWDTLSNMNPIMAGTRTAPMEQPPTLTELSKLMSFINVDAQSKIAAEGIVMVVPVKHIAIHMIMYLSKIVKIIITNPVIVTNKEPNIIQKGDKYKDIKDAQAEPIKDPLKRAIAKHAPLLFSHPSSRTEKVGDILLSMTMIPKESTLKIKTSPKKVILWNLVNLRPRSFFTSSFSSSSSWVFLQSELCRKSVSRRRALNRFIEPIITKEYITFSTLAF